MLNIDKINKALLDPMAKARGLRSVFGHLCRQLGSGNSCGWLGVSPSNHMKQPTSLALQTLRFGGYSTPTRLRRVTREATGLARLMHCRAAC